MHKALHSASLIEAIGILGNIDNLLSPAVTECKSRHHPSRDIKEVAKIAKVGLKGDEK